MRFPLYIALAAAAAPAPQTAPRKDEIRRLYEQKRFAEAAALLEDHLRAEPGDFPSRLLLGLAYQLQEQHERAQEVFEEAVRERPDQAAAWFYLARVQYLRRRLADAERNVRQALRLGENPGRVYNLLGLILEERDNHQQALDAFARAAAAAPDFAEPLMNAGVLLYRMARLDEAFEKLAAAEKLQPGSEEIRRHLERVRRARQQRRPAVPGPPPPMAFRDIAVQAGLVFAVQNHPAPDKPLPATMTGGVAVFDYDGDGLADIYFVNGAPLSAPGKQGERDWNRLFRNEGGWRFRDVTASAGVAGSGYAMGAAAADFDNDGRVDLFVAGFQCNQLFHNLGGGRFADVTARAGIRRDVWSVAAAWLDYDRDGLLDLFVVNYLDWQRDRAPFCGDAKTGFRVYCHPGRFAGLPNSLYRNRGDGTFEDVSIPSGIARHIGKGMSAAVADYDRDGDPDIFVANDAVPNFLFRNNGDGSFTEVALEAGVALPEDGKAVSSMGADFRDFDNDGWPDLSVTALAGERFLLFRNLGRGLFLDVTYPSRSGLLSAARSGWSNGFFDFNNDGWKDLFSANAHVTDNIDRYSHDRYRLTNSVFAGAPDGRFFDASVPSGLAAAPPRAHRGAAFADFDNDGRIDVVVSALEEPAELWRNESPEPGRWLRVRLAGTRSNRDGIGARVRADGQWNEMTSAVGYASSSHGAVHFGLGSRDRVAELEVLWPSGVRQLLRDVPAGQILVVTEPRE